VTTMENSKIDESEKPETDNDNSSFQETAEQTLQAATTEVEGDGLSKKGKKRLLRKQASAIHFEQQKKAKKERSKERNKENKTSSRSFRFGDNKSDSIPSGITDQRDNQASAISRSERKDALKKEFLNNCEKNFKVIIDLNWESHHSEKASNSLRQQIMYCYGNNKRHKNPALVHLTGLGPLLSVSLIEQNHAENWTGMEMTTEEYINLPEYSIAYDEDVKSGVKKQLVYLSSDAEETLDTLDVNCAYIIGGIVDRNSLKGITYKKAISQGIRTAKLPIKENYSLAATHILTVNHVFEILLNYASFGNWTQAMQTVLPQRKSVKVRDDNKKGESDVKDDDDNDEAKAPVSNVIVDSGENSAESHCSEIIKEDNGEKEQEVKKLA
jgi:tRNA (guanine9-N1)-methyltransferase